MQLLCLTITEYGSIGSFIASVISIFTLLQLIKQNKNAEKPQLYFNHVLKLKYNKENLKSAIPEIVSNIEESKIEYFNIGRDTAKNIKIKTTYNKRNFIEHLKIYGKTKYEIYNSKNIITFSSNIKNAGKTIKYGELERVGYLDVIFPENLNKQKKYFLLPDYYLKCIEYLLYEFAQTDNYSVFIKAPSLFIKTTFKDISGNKYKKYYKVTFYPDFKNESEVTFFIDEINEIKYILGKMYYPQFLRMISLNNNIFIEY